MADLKLDTPATEEIEVDDETLAAIDRGIEDAETGRSVSVDEARRKIADWISRFASQRPR